MLRFTEIPYVFREARPNRFIYELGTWVNRKFFLPGKSHRIARIETEGQENFAALRASPDARLVFVANHSTHSDAEVLGEALYRCDVWGAFMAAHEVFARNSVRAWCMQRMGAFSVNRENLDRRAIKEGLRLAKDKRCCLTLFPEGNVHFTNERVTEFLEGAAFMALKAQRDLKDTAKVYIVPTSIRFTHTEDVRSLLHRQLDELTQHLTDEGTEVRRDPSAPFHEQIEMIGHAILCRGLLRRGYDPPHDMAAWRSDPDATLENIAERILEKLEEEMQITPKGGIGERTRTLRSQLAKLRLEEGNDDDVTINRWDDESILVLRAQTYRAAYLREHPTVDRCAETLEKLREDLLDVLVRPESPRHVHVRFNEPVAIEKQSVTQLTSVLEDAVNDGLAAYQSPFPGGELMEG